MLFRSPNRTEGDLRLWVDVGKDVIRHTLGACANTGANVDDEGERLVRQSTPVRGHDIRDENVVSDAALIP